MRLRAQVCGVQIYATKILPATNAEAGQLWPFQSVECAFSGWGSILSRVVKQSFVCNPMRHTH